MSDRIIGPYYDFQKGQILKADHLNQMQQNIANEPIVIEYDFATQGIPEDIIDMTDTLGQIFYKISNQTFEQEDISYQTVFYSDYQGNKEQYTPIPLTDEHLFVQTEDHEFFSYYFSLTNGNYLIGFAQKEGTVTVDIPALDLSNIEITIPSPGIYMPYDASENADVLTTWYTKIIIQPTNTIVVNITDLNIGINEFTMDNVINYSNYNLYTTLLKREGIIVLNAGNQGGITISLASVTPIFTNDGSLFTITSYIPSDSDTFTISIQCVFSFTTEYQYAGRISIGAIQLLFD